MDLYSVIRRINKWYNKDHGYDDPLFELTVGLLNRIVYNSDRLLKLLEERGYIDLRKKWWVTYDQEAKIVNRNYVVYRELLVDMVNYYYYRNIKGDYHLSSNIFYRWYTMLNGYSGVCSASFENSMTENNVCTFVIYEGDKLEFSTNI